MNLADQPTQKQMVYALLAMFVGALVILFLVLNLNSTVEDLRDAQDEVASAHVETLAQGYINRAVACMDIINDGEIQLTEECVDPHVVAYFPPDLCDKISPFPKGCGSEV